MFGTLQITWCLKHHQSSFTETAAVDIMRLSCKSKTEPILNLCHAFNRETKDGRKMQHYSELLQKAVGTIVDQKEESDLESLFSFVETTALVDDIKGLDDFELICFLVIK